MFRRFLLILFPVTFLFISCADSSGSKISSSEFLTLKEEVLDFNKKTNWTDAIEPDRLSSNIKKVNKIASNVKLSSTSLAARSFTEDEILYPHLKGFGSLNTALVPPGLRTLISDFYEAFSAGKSLVSLTKTESIYVLALFYYSLKNNFPEYDAFVSKIKEGNSKDDSKLFNRIIIGEPFIEGINYMVPLRLYSDEKTLDLTLFCAEDKGSWKIDQIQFNFAGNNDDK